MENYYIIFKNEFKKKQCFLIIFSFTQKAFSIDPTIPCICWKLTKSYAFKAVQLLYRSAFSRNRSELSKPRGT